MSSAGPPSQFAAAATRVEGVDELLLSVFRPFTLIERLRLTLVSKRWQRLLLNELCVPPRHLGRAPMLIRRAAGLRRLDITGFHQETGEHHDLQLVLRGLSGIVGAQLREFVMWNVDALAANDALSRLSPEAALELKTSCPHLDSGCRLLLHAHSAMQAVELLDALPGRHAVRIAASTPLDAERAALQSLARHPRLAALDARSAPPTSAAGDEIAALSARWYADAVAAVKAALVSGESSLELLLLVGRPWIPTGEPAFASADDAEACFTQHAPAPVPMCALRSLEVVSHGGPPDGGVNNSFLRSVLPIARGSLRLLRLSKGACLAANT